MIVAGLGGFRSIVAEVVWFRADRLQDEGRYAELAQLSTWLTYLEPHTPEVPRVRPPEAGRAASSSTVSARRIAYFPRTSLSRFTASPTFTRPRFVSAAVVGITSTCSQSSPSPLTVSDSGLVTFGGAANDYTGALTVKSGGISHFKNDVCSERSDSFYKAAWKNRLVPCDHDDCHCFSDSASHSKNYSRHYSAFCRLKFNKKNAAFLASS